MDLSRKSLRQADAGKYVKDFSSIADEELDESRISTVFLPSEIPEELVLNEDFERHAERINQLRISFHSRQDMFSRLRAMVDALKERYPKIPRNKALLRRDSPENILLFDRMLGINQYQRKRKRSANTESDYTEESLAEAHSSSDDENTETFPLFLENNKVQIGSNGTCISRAKFDTINWQSTPMATRALLTDIFSVNVLATHTLTGKPSPAFYGRERPSKHRLDMQKVADIIECVTKMNEGANARDVRAAITTKCADASKKKRYLCEKSENAHFFYNDESSNDTGLDSETMSTGSH